MSILRRDFLKYCVGSAAALGLDFSPLGTLKKVLAAGVTPPTPTYPISGTILTTLEQTVRPYLPTSPSYPGTILLPNQVSEYAANGYGEWNTTGEGYLYVRPPMVIGGYSGPPAPEPSVNDPSNCATLLTFFTMSDIHICDKEGPAQCIYFGYEYPTITTGSTGSPPNAPLGNSSAYSAIILYTTHVLDAAVQTINALHKQAPFDFGIGLGDAANNTQYNELRWYIDVLDGKMIYPSSGAVPGPGAPDYQKPYQAAGLDKSISWYQAVGNHDQFWMGSAPVHTASYDLRPIYIGSNVLNFGPATTIPPNFTYLLSNQGSGDYMGLVNGATEYGDIIDAGLTAETIVADPNRRSLTINQWMGEFFTTTSQPAGHGFTQQMVSEGFACYHFYPRSNIPIKVIVLDDTDKVNGGAAGALDQQRYNWLVAELDAGQAAGELMVICAHIPLRPYFAPILPPATPPGGNPAYPLYPLWAPTSYISDTNLLAKLHTYSNLILWIAGHIHRNAITPQPSPDGDPEYGFWEVETPSLRDFPQQFRNFQIVRNSDNTISIFVLSVDPADNPVGPSPAWISRSYAIATQQIFQNQVEQGPNVDPVSGVYNAELVKQLSPAMQEKIARISPAVSYFTINGGASSTVSRIVTLNNTVVGSTPTHYMASESNSFAGAGWLPYSNAPSFTLSGSGGKIVYFKVKDGSGRQSAVIRHGIRAL